MKKKPDPQEEHEKKVKETTDHITAEDCVESAVLAAHSMSGCSDDHSDDALAMLGASVYDDEICEQEMV
jgi:hypothetical protein